MTTVGFLCGLALFQAWIHFLFRKGPPFLAFLISAAVPIILLWVDAMTPPYHSEYITGWEIISAACLSGLAVMSAGCVFFVRLLWANTGREALVLLATCRLDVVAPLRDFRDGIRAARIRRRNIARSRN